jgi:hypothetical protein
MEIFNIICYIILYLIGFSFTFYKLIGEPIYKVKFISFLEFFTTVVIFICWLPVFIIGTICATFTIFTRDWPDIFKLR